jgi:hypothetical protein
MTPLPSNWGTTTVQLVEEISSIFEESIQTNPYSDYLLLISLLVLVIMVFILTRKKYKSKSLKGEFMKGYSNDLYILAFDHRGTLTKGLLGVEGRPPTDEEAARVSSMKDIIFDGFLEAQNKGISGGDPAILVDETFGLQVQQKAKEMGIKFAAPVEKSGQKIFDFEYGDDFGEKIKEVDADFVKILVRWNPSDDSETRQVQG